MEDEEVYEELVDEEVEEEEDLGPQYRYIEILDAPRELPDPVDLTEEQLKVIANELGLIKLCWPEIENPEFENRINFPQNYLQNSAKEKLLLLYAENFRRQFCHKFPHRKQIFLACDNECGMQKMVCTTVRPTTLSFPELESWESCAKYIGCLLKYEPLEIPTLIPSRLYSPHTTFMRQSGQSQELATALCSLLIGLGYDAYVVFGYATRDVALKIMTRVDSPYPPATAEEAAPDEGETKTKYAMKAPRDLRSKFLLMMEQREVDKAKAEVEKRAEEERQRVAEEEKPPFDELDGLRVHAWVLLRPEGRPIDETIFIEPSTGRAHSLDTNCYSGIESVWNHLNYWVNMQDCSNGLGTMDYDLANVEKWEHFLIGEPLGWRKTKIDLDMDDDEIALMQIMEEKHLDMPFSWSSRIHISHEVLQKKFPDGVNKTWYKRTLVEEYAAYVQTDGLVTQITRFSDFECTQIESIESLFENRSDKMEKMVYDVASDTTTEYFGRGRDDAVKKHTYSNDQNAEDAKRIIEFYHTARYDGLSIIEMTKLSMVEHYIDREDFMYYSEATYAEKGHPPPGVVEGPRRIILRMFQKFLRNDKLPASEDIATREFFIVGREIHLKYHFGEGRVTASTRTFIKPSLAEMGEGMKFNPSLTYGYQAEIGAKPPRQLQLYLLLERLLVEEEKSLLHTREVEDQVVEFLALRDQEIAFPKLDVSLFNREQNEEHRLAMLEREKQEQEHREKEIEGDEVDYLAPYLAQMGYPSKISQRRADLVKKDCLQDFKQMLIDRAQDIQNQFEYWSTHLLERQAWYSANIDNLTDDEEIEYFHELNDLNFLLQCYEIRLTRHKEMSSVRYAAIVHYLNNHPILNFEQ